jgi:lipopolysaccharide assembly outer membrane protein LptD (OstA)
MKKNWKSIARSAVASLCCLWISLVLVAESEQLDSSAKADSLQLDSLFYQADSVYYSVEDERIDLISNAQITYHSSKIEANTISIDIEKNQAVASGQAILTDKDQVVLSQQLHFDLETQWGVVQDGASQFDKGFYYGKEFRKIEDKVFDVDDGSFTTCDHAEPHFYIQSGKLRLYHNDKVVAKPIVFYVNHFPIMWLPFGTFTVRRGRHSGILVPSPNYTSEKGKSLEDIALFYGYSDYADVFLIMDYYEKTGWAVEFLTDYVKRYEFNGKLSTKLQKDIRNPQFVRYDWQVLFQHNHFFRDQKTLGVDLHFVSGKQVWEGSSDLDERLNERITSSISYKQQLWGRNLFISGNYSDDLINKRKDITLPSVRYSLPSKPVYELFGASNQQNDAWWSDFSYSYSFRAIHQGKIEDPDAEIWDILYKTKKDSLGNYVNQHNAGIKHYGSISFSRNLRGWLNLSQSVSYNEAWFDRDKNNRKLVRGYDYSANSKVQFSLYGIRTFHRSFLRAIRHIITPSATFTYKPDFSKNDKYYSFGGVSLNTGKKSRQVSFQTGNKWQLKFRGADPSQDKKLNDFLTIRSSLSYDLEKEGKKFSDISHTLQINTGEYKFGLATFNVDPTLSIYQDTYGLKFQEWNYKEWDWAVKNWVFNLNNRLSFSGNANYIEYFPKEKNQFVTQRYFQTEEEQTETDPLELTLKDLEELEAQQSNWSFTLTHSYRTDKAGYKANNYSSDLRSAMNLDLTKNWKFSYNNTYDIKEKKLMRYEITLKRKLHCWEIVFSYEKSVNYWRYNLRIFNLVLPDALQLKTSDHN